MCLLERDILPTRSVLAGSCGWAAHHRRMARSAAAHVRCLASLHPCPDSNDHSHGRDNKIRCWQLPQSIPALRRSSAHAVPSPKRLDALAAVWEMDVNAMAYCRMSLMPLPSDAALVAVPALTKDDQVDIFHLPTQQRLHRSIGHELFPLNDKTGQAPSAIDIFTLMDAARIRHGPATLQVCREGAALATSRVRGWPICAVWLQRLRSRSLYAFEHIQGRERRLGACLGCERAS